MRSHGGAPYLTPDIWIHRAHDLGMETHEDNSNQYSIFGSELWVPKLSTKLQSIIWIRCLCAVGTDIKHERRSAQMLKSDPSRSKLERHNSDRFATSRLWSSFMITHANIYQKPCNPADGRKDEWVAPPKEISIFKIHEYDLSKGFARSTSAASNQLTPSLAACSFYQLKTDVRCN